MAHSSTTSTESGIDDTVRQATGSRSPLAELIADPILFRSLTKSRYHKDRSRSSNRRDEKKRERERERNSDSASQILSVVLAEEEREVQHLKTQLVVLGEQLKSYMRRAVDAEDRARAAQSKEREAQARAEQAEQAKHRLELEAARQEEELRRHRQTIEMLERKSIKLEHEMRILEREKERAEEAASDAKDSLRLHKQLMRDVRTKEEGLEEGKRLGLRRGYSNGRLNGWKLGKQDGFHEGLSYGRQEGRMLIGRRPERPPPQIARALDSYVDVNSPVDMDSEDGENLRRTKSWAESLSQEYDTVPVEASSLHSSTVGDGVYGE